MLELDITKIYSSMCDDNVGYFSKDPAKVSAGKNDVLLGEWLSIRVLFANNFDAAVYIRGIWKINKS